MATALHASPTTRAQAFRRLGLLAVVLVASMIVAPLAAALSPGHFYVVASGSMEPAIPTGSLVLAKPGAIEVGTIIVYASVGGVAEVHRVVEVREGPVYVTKGDANVATDSYLVTPEDVLGVASWHTPYLGRLWLMPTLVQVGLFVAFLAGYLAITAWDARGTFRGNQGGKTFGVLLLLALLLASNTSASLASIPAGSVVGAAVATTPLPLSIGTMGSATVTGDSNGGAGTAAAPKVRSEIVLWSCRAAATTCPQALPALAYADEPGSLVYVAPASYAPTPSFYFEAVLVAPAGQTAFAILRDRNLSLDVPGTEVSTTSTTAVLVRAGPFSLGTAASYGVAIKNSGLTAAGQLLAAKLLVEQDLVGFGGTATMRTLVPLSSGSQAGASGFGAPTRAARWSYDAADWDGVTGGEFSFVASVSAATVTGEVRLFDRTAGAAVATVSVPATALSATRFAANVPVASLVDGHEYELEFRRSAGSGSTRVRLELAHLLLHQSAFTRGIRYVDLSWQTTTGSSAFATAGFDGAFFADVERGAPIGYLEATMFGSTAGVTTTARVVNGVTAAVYATSTAAVKGTTATRVRSAAITLDGHDDLYAVEISRSSGTGTLRHAWLLVPQVAAKTYDSLLATTNAVGVCTWSFTASLVSSTNVARLGNAKVQLRGTGSPVDQVVIASGVVTQSSGGAVTAAPTAAVHHVVVTQPSSAGTSTLEVDVLGACGGLHTAQRIVYTLN